MIVSVKIVRTKRKREKTTSRLVPIRIGTKLNTHRPVAIRYDSSLATQDPKLYNPETTLSGLGGTISYDMLNGGVLKCSSC
jgi:hypothetical protein